MKTLTGTVAIAMLFAATSHAAAPPDGARVDELVRAIEPRVVEWRRDIHQNPELSNREFRTSKLVAEHLRRLGIDVQTGIAHTGVAGFLKGGRPGPTIALRADMDALPVTEKTDVPFASRVTSTYRGEKVGVMHACGHDVHTAILMGVAETLAKMRDSLAGNVLFVFQPAEEGAPEGEEGGAKLMLQQGLFDTYRPQVIFGLHAWSPLHVGEIGYRSGPMMAAADSYRVVVRGKQSHGSRPWQGVDPVVASAQIINALQTVVSRQIDLTANPAVVSVGAIKGGIRNNIIPDSVEFIGTIRTFTPEQRTQIIERMRRIIESTAAASGATAEFSIDPDGNPVTFNDPELTQRMLPTLRRVAGEDKVKPLTLITGAEDFSYFAQKVPGLFIFLGITPPDQDASQAPANHSDYFYVDERSIPMGLRALTQLTLDYMEAGENTNTAPGTR